MHKQYGRTWARMGVFAGTALLAGAAVAHPGHADSVVQVQASFGSGFAHPFSGADHLLAMVAVGLWAAQHKQRAAWMLPVVFPLMMIAGALLAFAGLTIPGVETGIAASVAVLGLLVAFAVRMPLAGSAAVVSLFAVFHGYAHGVELPHGASAALYGAGFVLATALLHGVGAAAGVMASRKIVNRMVRFAGVGIAAVGAYLLMA